MPKRGRRPRKTRAGARQSSTAVSSSGRVAWWLAAAVFAAVFVVYSLTLLPTAVDQDSGEIATVAHVLGVAHPTGYPLWALLGRGFDLLPLGGSTAFRVGLVSAASAAGAAALICWLVSAIGGTAVGGVFAGLAFAFWFPTWSQAVRAEVYALEALLFAFFLVALWRWDADRSARRLAWLALAGGFVAMHHRTGFLAAAPALAVAFALTRPRRAISYARAMASFAAPFLFYLYLPIRAAANPPLNWGKPDTWERFIAHVGGRQYAKWAFMNSWEMVVSQARVLWGESLAGPGLLSVGLAVAGGLLIVWGCAVWIRRRPAVMGPLAAGAGLLLIWVLEWGDVSDSKVWLLPVGAVLAVFGGLGLARLAHVMRGRNSAVAAGVVGAALCAVLLGANWGRADQSDVWRYRDQWASALLQMDENAIFVAEWDTPMFQTWYLQQVEGLRPDVTFLRPLALSEQWYQETMQDEELRDTASRVWSEVRKQIRITEPGTPEVWDAVAMFARGLASEYEGRRTVYALHGGLRTPDRPPWFIGVNDSLYRLSFEQPQMISHVGATREVAAPPSGVHLVSLQFGRDEVRTGELVGFLIQWRLERPLPGVLFALRFVPAQLGRPIPSESDALIVQGYPVLYGLWGSGASPAGTVYEQRGSLLIPSNLPPGAYAIEIGSAQSYPPTYGGWTEVAGVKLRIRD